MSKWKPFKAALVVLAIFIVLAGCSNVLSTKSTPEITFSSTPTAIPTPTPDPTPTPSPTPEPTPIPTPTPIFHQYYYDDGERVHILDNYWEYSSRDLSVRVKKVYREDCESWVFISHIYTSSPQNIQVGYGGMEPPGYGKQYGDQIGTAYQAVWGQNVDYFYEENNSKAGIVIREGKVYRKTLYKDMLAIYPNGEFKVFRKDEITVEELLSAGVRNTFSFGPIVIENGQATEECSTHWLRNKNPRSGIGMVEPGHYVSIVVDGRQAGVSRGATLEEYSKIFLEEGCTLAYNFDGGQSTSAVFMGKFLNSHALDYRWQGYRKVSELLYFGNSQLVPYNVEDMSIKTYDTLQDYLDYEQSKDN